MMKREKRHSLVLFIDTSKVINSVDNKAYILTKTLPKDTDIEVKTLLMDIAQEPNRTELAQMVMSSVTELYEYLAGYTKHRSCQLEIIDNDLELHDFKIHLTVPDTFPMGMSEALRVHAQNYIATGVVRRWIYTVVPALGETYDALLLEEYNNIATIMQSRTVMPKIKPTVL